MTAREAAIRRAVLRWYRGTGRDLPWRKTRDPYAVLVSEMMLQQQTVARVVPVYVAVLERFPTVEALAAASRADLVRVWSAIGLNRQAVRLHALARAVAESGAGLPRGERGLMAFPGIGRYTAAAVLCFAYGERRAMVDTNIRRVLGRVLRGGQDALPGEAAWEVATAVLPRGKRDVYDWNQALMDLGATVCRARAAKCGECPVRRWCAARRGPDGGADARRGAPYARTVRMGREVREARAGYAVKQPRRHEGSMRQLRGRVVRALAEAPRGAALTPMALMRRLPEAGVGARAALPEVLVALEKGGVVASVRRRGRVARYTLAEG